MLKKLFLAFMLAAALATGIFAGVGQPGDHGMLNVPAAGACPVNDPGCPG